ncbi:nitroreductase family protein [Methanobrevibacter olleyae]|uniref:Nitroreductase n=1 Tax=Methanobrevibacter olleyae TaxID=294671 RepID=A0A126QYJ0_METOL|nr:nitroreductase family protein [Methanobrevibacter olleyae]AMK15091.1 nitroreductase family protein [Methanobrevibacter olleyae]SFL76556.1 Nitroreductase [Methanobrevibacter olleyae]
MNIIFKRKSIRKFLDKEIEDEKIIRLLKAGMQAPSAINSQPWEFLVVKNKEGIKKIENMSLYSKPAKTSACCIITLFNKEYTDKFEDYKWIQQDMGACSQNILLQAVEEDLGAVWLGTYPDEERVNYLKENFNIPENVYPYSVIVLGYPTEDYHGKNRFKEDRIHYESY